ncbi:RdRp [Xingshan nematode virus 5]|uniref:RdRp n=1 Tax=Xingshan nematode virus 5 TaxID=1923764 RepID=UPI000909BF6E|nr:RdRp [Xingshan nematode virus 5]APG75962.1 RdRp [Xingshan nematode virus 5]
MCPPWRHKFSRSPAGPRARTQESATETPGFEEVGWSYGVYSRMREPTINPLMEEALRPYAELFQYTGQYAWPPRGPEAERVSLRVHARLRAEILAGMQEPTHDEEEWLVAQTVKAYRPARWEIPDDFLSWTHFMRVVARLERNSSPGWPYCRQYGTLKLWIGEILDPDEAGIRMLWDLVQGRLRGDEAHPIRLFVKPEPHKISKLQEGRYRLISSVNVVDQVIDHMLFDMQNDREIAVHLDIPSKPGWSPARGGWRMLQQFETAVSCDKSLWDWGMPWWVARLDLKVRASLCMNMQTAWMELAERRYRELYQEARFITSDGQIFAQKTGGLQKSGCVNTISTNSRGQYLLHMLACLRSGEDHTQCFWAMGDDTLQERASEKYCAELGKLCRLKEVTPGIVFAGTRLDSEGVHPEYCSKHYFTLLHKSQEAVPDTLSSYVLLYARDQRLEALLEVARRLVPGVWRSAVELRGWYDGLID